MKWCSVHMSVLHPPITQDHTQSVSQSAKKGVEASHEFAGLFVNRRPRLTIPSMFISSMWDVKGPTHYSKRVGREVSQCCGCPLCCSFRVGASHRDNLMHLSPLDRNVQEKWLCNLRQTIETSTQDNHILTWSSCSVELSNNPPTCCLL